MKQSIFSPQMALASGALLAGAMAPAPQCFGSAVGATPSYYAFQFTNGTGSSQSSLSMVLNGNQTGGFSGLYSAGGYENSLGGTSSASYTSGTGTTITFSASNGNSLANNANATVGFSWNRFSAPPVTSVYWGNGGTGDNISPLPITAVAYEIPAPWAVFTYTIAGTDYWFEQPYASGVNPFLQLTNSSASNETLSSVGYMLSDTLIPLDNLNYSNEPPPGINGSPFTAIPSLDGYTLDANGGNTAYYSVPTPEPATWALLALAGTGLLLLGRRKNIAD